MSMHRTTILLDDESRQVARELASRYECSTSEAIRRAILRQRDAVSGIPPADRARRRAALEELFTLFEGHDAEAETRRLKEEDEGF